MSAELFEAARLHARAIDSIGELVEEHGSVDAIPFERAALVGEALGAADAAMSRIAHRIDVAIDDGASRRRRRGTCDLCRGFMVARCPACGDDGAS